MRIGGATTAMTQPRRRWMHEMARAGRPNGIITPVRDVGARAVSRQTARSIMLLAGG